MDYENKVKVIATVYIQKKMFRVPYFQISGLHSIYFSLIFASLKLPLHIPYIKEAGEETMASLYFLSDKF